MVGSPHPFAVPGLGFNPTAVPVSAVLNGPMNQVDVTFDPDIVDAPSIDLANWSVRWNNVDRTVIGASIVANVVVLGVVAGGADVGIDRVTYAPPPFDVLTTVGGNPVLAFADFPLTM